MTYATYDSDYGNKYDSAYTQQRVDGKHPYDIERVGYTWEDAAEAHAYASMRADHRGGEQLDDWGDE